MALKLVTVAGVKDRMFTQTSIRTPPGLSDGIIGDFIDGATAIVLRRLRLSSLPSSDLQLQAAKRVCYELVEIDIRRRFFGLDSQAMSALNSQARLAMESLDAERDDAIGDVVAKTVGGLID